MKAGHSGAMAHLGYAADATVDVALHLDEGPFRIGEALDFEVHVRAAQDLPVVVDYRLRFHRPSGRVAEKVFKLKVAEVRQGEVLILKKRHKLKADATTFELHPGPHQMTVQVNGADRARAEFDLV